MEEWLTLDGKGGLDLSLLNLKGYPTEVEQTEFFSWLGRAIAQWQHVETSLFTIASTAIRADNVVALGAMFHSQFTFKGRLDAVNAAIPASLALPETVQMWKALANKLKAAGEQRNKFAHGQTFFDPSRKEGERLFVSGNYWNHKNWGKIGVNGDGITTAMLKERAESFANLQHEVWMFGGTLAGELKPMDAGLKGLFGLGDLGAITWEEGKGLLGIPLQNK